MRDSKDDHSSSHSRTESKRSWLWETTQHWSELFEAVAQEPWAVPCRWGDCESGPLAAGSSSCYHVALGLGFCSLQAAGAHWERSLATLAQTTSTFMSLLWNQGNWMLSLASLVAHSYLWCQKVDPSKKKRQME